LSAQALANAIAVKAVRMNAVQGIFSRHFLPLQKNSKKNLPFMDGIALESRTMSEGSYVAYILASSSRTLSIGVTSDLRKRVFSHKLQVHEGFTAQDTCDRLVWYASYPDASLALAREQQLKEWPAEKLQTLISAANPEWTDLSQDWFEAADFEIVLEQAPL
jgi:putative endonuclease